MTASLPGGYFFDCMLKSIVFPTKKPAYCNNKYYSVIFLHIFEHKIMTKKL